MSLSLPPLVGANSPGVLSPDPDKPVSNGIADLRKLLEERDFDRAVNKLLYLCDHIEHLTSLHKKSEIQELYACLFKLISYAASQSMNPIQKLLDFYPEFKDEQRELAEKLGDWHKSQAKEQAKKKEVNPLSSCLTAMKYYAKAIQLDSASSHYAMNELFIIVIPYCLNKRLESAVCFQGEEGFRQALDGIKDLESFCTHQNDLKSIYEQVEAVLLHLDEKYKERYRPFSKKIEGDSARPFSPPTQFVAQKYQKELQRFRALFSASITTGVRPFQASIFQGFKSFFSLLLKDALALVGPPPGNISYDIRAMGSIGRQEISPFSDLEYMILVEKSEGIYASYFQTLSQILELQICSLGETAAELKFTALRKNHHGFHVDVGGNPGNDPEGIKTPQKMAKLQQETRITPQSLRCTSLKSISLEEKGDALFESFKAAVAPILDENKREELMKGLLTQRLKDFQDRWQSGFSPIQNIKEKYIELIHHTLKDLSHYFEVYETNTLDIITALVQKEKGVFTSHTGQLLHEVVSSLYLIRMRLHLHYGSQNDEGVLPPHARLDACSFLKQEVESLEKAYVLVLQPLYSIIDLVMKGEKSLKEAFQAIDLVKIGWDKGIRDHQTNPSLLNRFVYSWITTFPNEEAEHVSRYKQLWELEKAGELGEYYIKTLEEIGKKDLANKLNIHPNKVGTRCSSLKDNREIDKIFLSITDKNPQSDRNIEFVKVTHLSFQRKLYLKSDVIQAILDDQGNIKRSYQSKHPVSATGNLHFKQEPQHPLMEFAIHDLTSRIAGRLTPETELVRFEVKISGNLKTYPVLLSRTIHGMPLKTVLQDKPQLDLAHWTWAFLCAILTKPGDGRFSNYIVSENKVYCIDNDVSFVEPVDTESRLRKINFFSALFLIPYRDLCLDEDVLRAFCELEVDFILNRWMDEIIAKEAKYLSLFSLEERKQLFNSQQNGGFTPTILFKEGVIATLNLQFLHLKNIILAQLKLKKKITPLELLRHIITLNDLTKIQVGSYIFSKYEKALTELSIKTQVALITGRQSDQSMSTLESYQAMLSKIPTLEEIENRRLFEPSKAKNELIVSLLAQYAKELQLHFRISGNDAHIGKMNQRRVCQASFYNILLNGSPDISRQKQILQFLLQIVNQEQGPEMIALRHCFGLDSNILEQFLHPNLKILDLSFSPITDNDVRKIKEKCPELRELHLVGCSHLNHFANVGILWDKNLVFPKLEVLDLRQCGGLETIRLDAPNLKSLPASRNPNLRGASLGLHHSSQLMDFQKDPHLDLALLKNDALKIENDFGKVRWETHIGTPGPIPPLPLDISLILKSPCFFWGEQTVEEAQMLALIPEMLNDKPLSLSILDPIAAMPKQGTAVTLNVENFNLVSHTKNDRTPASHWVLMTKKIVPGSEEVTNWSIFKKTLDSLTKNSHEKQAFVEECRQFVLSLGLLEDGYKKRLEQDAFVEKINQRNKVIYKLPTFLEATISLCIEVIACNFTNQPFRITCDELAHLHLSSATVELDGRSLRVKARHPMRVDGLSLLWKLPTQPMF